MQPTALTIRHSRFAALTLAKLVASLALHPPSSATGNGGLRASPPPAAEPLLKEKPFGGRIFLHYKKVHSPSSVSLFARHLLPFGRRLLCSCASQETWPFYLTIANSRSRQMRANISPWHADRRSARGVRSTTEGEIFKGTDGACADPGTQNFPCHGGGAAGGQGHSQFYSIGFYVYSAAFFDSFLGSKKES